MKKKIAYISIPFFSDVDISLLSELQKKADVYYFVPLLQGNLSSTAINIRNFYPKTGLFKASIYPELNEFASIIDLDKMYVLNCCASKGWSLNNLKVNLQLFLFLLKNKFDIIHLTTYPIYFDLWKLLFFRKTVLTVHDPFPHPHDQNFLNAVYRKLSFSLFKNFIILNKSQKIDFIKYYGLQNKNVYDSKLSVYSYLHKYKLVENIKGDKYLLFFGRITSYKGLSYLFKAMDKIHLEYPDLKLIVAGKGRFDFDISSYEKSDYIKIYNRFIPDSELSILIQKSLFVICPYITATQSGVIMSSFAFGKPVVATDVGGLAEMVLHEQYGLIIPPKNIDSIVDAIRALMLNPDKLRNMENNIKNDFLKGEKSWEYISKDYVSIYNSLIMDVNK